MEKEDRAPLLSAQDPFYAVRDAVEGQLRTLSAKFDGWRGLLRSVDTSSDVAFKMRHEEVKKDLLKLSEVLRKVRASVALAEQDRVKFAHIDEREISSRKAALGELDGTLTAMRTEFHSRETDDKMASDERKALSRRVNMEVDESNRSGSAYAQGNAAHLSGGGQDIKLITRQQDEMVSKMGQGLSTLKEMATAINSELNEQEVIVDEIDQATDKVQTNMDMAIKTMEKLTGSKNNCQLCTIFILVVIFVVGEWRQAARARAESRPPFSHLSLNTHTLPTPAI